MASSSVVVAGLFVYQLRIAVHDLDHAAHLGLRVRDVIDQVEKIDEFLPTLDELITEGLVVRENVEVVKYVGRPAES